MNALRLKDGAACYRTVDGVRWSWWPAHPDVFKSHPVRHRASPDRQGTFVHPDDEEQAWAAIVRAESLS